MGETTDQLREEIAAKREDAAAKIDQIEAKVQEIPQLARDTVDASIQQARTSVGETVGKMADKVSLKQQVEQRPLAALGAAIAGGWLLGKLLGGNDASRGKSRSGYRYDRSASTAGVRMDASHGAGSARFEDGGYESQASGARFSQGQGGGGVIESIRGAARQAGLENTLSAFTGALIGTLSDQLLKTIDQTFPEFGDKLRQETSARQRQAATARGTRTFGADDSGSMPTGSGYAYGTSDEGAMRHGASGGAGTGPGEGSGYSTQTGAGTGVGYGTGASAGAYTGGTSGSSGASGSSTGGFRTTGSGSGGASSPSGS